MAFAQINKADIYYELHGSGQPVILIAGYTCDHTYWTPILEPLIKHYQILICDNHAIGQTKDNNMTLSAELMARDVIALAQQLHLEKPHIVGQSMGGNIAQVIASSYPDKINKLCILNSVAKWRQAMLLALKALLTMRESNINFDLIFEASLPWFLGEEFLKNKEEIKKHKQAMIDNPYPQSINDQTRQLKVLEQFDARTQLQKIKAPTLVVYGVQDLIALPDESKFLAHEISNVTLRELDCAHDSVVEVPKELTQILVDFLR